MKTITTACGLLTLGCLLPLSAQVTQTTEEKSTHQNADGSVTHSETTTTHTFNPDARTKVVSYFDTYKGNPHGLPPGWVEKVHVKEIPTAWRTTRITPGAVVTEKERTYLVDAPPDLVQMLPPPSDGVHYYVAGSNVVAVDPSYKIVDSIHIPTIKYKEDDDNIEIETKDGHHKTKMKIDKDDGEIEKEEKHD